MTTRTKTERKWVRWLKVIKIDVTKMAIHRHFYREVGKILQAKPNGVPAAFQDWLRDSYVTYMPIGVRRQLDRDRRAISLANLLREIAEHPEVMSQRRFLLKYSNTLAKPFAKSHFKQFSHPSLAHVDPKIVKKDLKELRVRGRRVKKYVDKVIAHRDRRPPRNLPTFKELDDCQEFLEQLLKKYVLLFEAVQLMQVLPVEQFEWRHIFR